MAVALAGKPATSTVQWTDGDGATITPTGTVTVTARRSDGTLITGLTVTPVEDTPGAYSTTLSAADTSQLDRITFTWQATSGGAQATYLDVVGAHLFTIDEARLSDRALQDTNKYTDTDIVRARDEVTEEAEAICRQSFVPKFRRVTLDGDGTSHLILPDIHVRRLRSLSVGGYGWTTDALSQAVAQKHGVLTVPYHLAAGYQNVVVTYEYGHDAPPSDLKRAALTRLRHRLNMAASGIPDRATSFTMEGGGTFALATAGRAGFETGIPDVDAVYFRYRDQAVVIA